LIVEHFPVGPLQCNCVIIGDETTKDAVVVDPGDEAERIFAALQKHGLTVRAVVATHAHIDHVGALANLKQLTGAPAMIHEADVPLYEHLAEQAGWLGVRTPQVTTLDRYLRDGDRVAVGAHVLDVLHTPGHSPGSLSFIVDDRSPLVLAGDTLFAGSIGRTDLWGGSFAQIIDSIRHKLLTLPDEVVVVPGHGPRTTIGTERESNPFLTGES
jgi:glyoxylase-like metal-dependent hydrolase (beta-lactamase superfamily II)